MSRKGGTGRGGWGVVHMAAARLGYKRTMVGTGWANSRPGCTSRLRKRYSHILGFISGSEGFLGLQAGVYQPRVLTIACSLMSGRS